MIRNFKLISLVMSLVFCFSTIAFGQETTGSIEGTVKDANGAVVPGVTVTIKGVSIGFNRSTVTNDEGFFFVPQIPPGTYKITTDTVKGFAASSTDTSVAVGKATNLSIGLQVSGSSAVVDVNSATTVGASIDTAASSIQTNISERTTELVPKGQNFNSVIRLAPSTRFESKSGGFQSDGASGSENSFVIDGQEVSNFRTGVLNANNNVPNSFVSEVQVKTSGFNAEFGGATGAVVSVVTKGGTNEFHGQFGMDFESQKLQGAPNRFLVRRTPSSTGVAIAQYFTPAKDSGVNVYPTATLGGKIIKDRLWYFLNYSPQILDTQRETTYLSSGTLAQTASETYAITQKNEYAFARLDASPTDNLRLTGSFTWNPIAINGQLPAGATSIGGAPPSVAFGGNIGTLTGRSYTNTQGGRQNSNNMAFQGVWTPSSTWAITGRYSRGFLNERSAAYAIPNFTRYQCADNYQASGDLDDPTTAANEADPIKPGGNVSNAETGCQPGFQNVSNNLNNFFDVSVRKNFEADASVYVNNFGGNHQIKFGYQNTQITNSVSQGYRNTGRVILYYGYSIEDLTGQAVPLSADSVGAGILRRFATEGSASNKAQSLYIQDQWQPVSRLTINAGVRMEKEDLPSFNGFAPPINFGFGDKIVPRIGVSFDLFGDGKSKIFGSYSQFNDRLRFELPRGSFGGDFFRDDYFEITRSRGVTYTSYTFANILGTNTDILGGKCPITTNLGYTRCQFDFRIASNSPVADIYTGQVDPDLKPFRQDEITVAFEREMFRNYLLTARYVRKEVIHAVEDAGFPTLEGSEAYIIGNPGEGLHLATAKQFGYNKVAKPERLYNALQLILERRLNNNLYFNTNYTYSRLRGNYSGLASSDENGRTSPGVNRFFDLPFVGFTATGASDTGPLATDRPHVFNAYGAYIFDWKGWGSKSNSTEFGFFTTAQSGTPQTSTFTFYNVTTILAGRNDLGRTGTFTQTDIQATHKYKFGADARYSMEFNVNISNLFNERNILGVYTQKANPGINVGDSQLGVANEPAGINLLFNSGILNTVNTYLATRTDARYGLADTYQGGRFVRFGFKFKF